MWNLNDDNELDNLSREAAEGFPLDQLPDSWNKIHARLDAEMPEERRRRYLLFFLFFLVIGSGVFWITRMNNNNQSISDDGIITSNEPAVNSTSDKAATSSSEVNKSAANKNVSAPASVQQSKAQGSSVPSPTVDGTRTANSNNQNVSTTVSSTNKNVSASYNKQQKVGTRNGNKLSTAAAIGVGAATTKSNKSKGNKNQKVVDASDNDVAANPEVSQGSNDHSVAPKIDQPAAETSDKAEKTDKKINHELAEASKKSEPHEKETPSRDNIRWTFGAVYAPDISTVNFTHTQPAGLNIGVTIDYRLSQKFSLQTAFIYTKKNYKVNGDDYHPPKGTWIDYVNMKDVTGNCSMFDIPLNLRYNAVRRKSFNIFFTTGLSSYLMKKEQYTYYYYYNGNPNSRDRAYQTNDDYLFSIINFSAGAEKKLNKSFSLQVEPFFKQTLTGVGFGNISLNSTGIYFSLRYNPLKPAKTIAAKNK